MHIPPLSPPPSTLKVIDTCIVWVVCTTHACSSHCSNTRALCMQTLCMLIIRGNPNGGAADKGHKAADNIKRNDTNITEKFFIILAPINKRAG